MNPTAPSQAVVAVGVERRQDVLIPEKYLTKVEVAALVRKTTRTVDAWMALGLLPYYKISRTVLFRLSDVQRHLDQNFRVNRLSSGSRSSTKLQKEMGGTDQ